jgi:hypothetical protein
MTPSRITNRFSPFRFHADQLARQIVAGCLAERRDRIRRESLPRRHAYIDAVLETFGAEVGAPFERRDDRIDRRRDLRGDADLAITAKRERTQIRTLVQAVRDDDLFAGRIDLIRRVRNVHPIDLRRVEQATRVIAQTKDHRSLGRRVRALAFEHGRAVVQRVSENVDLRPLPRHELAVVPDVFGGADGHGLFAPVNGASI